MDWNWFYLNLVRPVYYIFVRGLLGAILIAIGPGLLLQTFMGEKAVTRLMEGTPGEILGFAGGLWFIVQFYKGMKAPVRMLKRPRAT